MSLNCRITNKYLNSTLATLLIETFMILSHHYLFVQYYLKPFD